MSRSIKKGPYIEASLEKRILAMNKSNKKEVVKTWSRSSMISPDFVGHTVAVHNGNKFIPVYVTENMVGHKLGEFAPTRTFRGHSGNHNEEAAAAAPSGTAVKAAPGAAPAAAAKPAAAAPAAKPAAK
jgi:small subunit ribosomal protein S19